MSLTKLNNIGQMVSFNSKLGEMESLNNIEILIKDDKIEDIGNNLSDADINIDCNKMLITPGFVDSHTHPVFYKSRSKEFVMRLSGMTYEEIAKNGGGITSSVSGLRNATENELIQCVQNRMDSFLSLGTTTVECKSGYGLDVASEIKSLKVIHEVNKLHSIDMVPTFMGGHAIPNEYSDNRDAYVDIICNEMIPEVAKQGIAVFNDVFCEKGYFNVQQSQKILNAGINHGLQPRLHADEFEDSGASVLAGEIGSITADHLMEISEDGISSLSKNDVIATLLPGTTFFLGKTKYAPYSKLKESGIDIALATDYNPGSCNIQSMPFIISLACIYMKMDILDALKASTYTAACSLLLQDTIGSIECGKKADIIIWNIEKIEEIPYLVLNQPIQNILKNGKPIFSA